MKRRLFLKSALGTGLAPFLLPKVNWGLAILDLPKVLLIGDSISIGYTPHVKTALQNVAEVSRIAGNAQHTWNGLKKIDSWLGMTQWDLIHFNWGLWDLCYRNPKSTNQGKRDKINGTLTTSLEEYDENLRTLVARLKETQANLIWASTTPVPEGELGRIEGDDLIYNAAAKIIMEENNIEINDLHTFILPGFDTYQKAYGDVHYTSEGYEYIGLHVAEIIKEALFSTVSVQKIVPKMSGILWDQGDYYNLKGQVKPKFNRKAQRYLVPERKRPFQ